MKKLFSALFILLFSHAIFAQEVSKSYDKIERFDQGVARVWIGGHCGLISQATKKEIIPVIYDKIGSFGHDALAITSKDGMKGLITIEGKVIVGNIYTSIGDFHGPYAITRKNGLAGMINKQGKVLIENKYEEIRVEGNGIIRGKKDGKEVLLTVKD